MTEKQMNARNQKIVKLYKTGKFSYRELSRKVNLSKTRLQEIVTKY